MEFSYNLFPNIGVIKTDVPSDLLLELNKIIHEKKLEEANAVLAGNIKKEFYIKKAIPIFEDYIKEVCLSYDEKTNYLKKIKTCTNPVPLVLDNMWVNFQEKHEFNPMHNHSGIFSFVIWVSVPFYMEEEIAISPGKKSNGNRAGCFEFQYCDALGRICDFALFVDKTWEGKMCLFPSSLKHCVYPFYSSNDYRVSVSGNVFLKT